MTARRRRFGRATAVLIALLLSFAAGACVGTAQAKSLGTLTSRSLLGTTIDQHGVTDNFNESNNLLLDGTSTADGDLWDVTSRDVPHLLQPGQSDERSG